MEDDSVGGIKRLSCMGLGTVSAHLRLVELHNLKASSRPE